VDVPVECVTRPEETRRPTAQNLKLGTSIVRNRLYFHVASALRTPARDRRRDSGGNTGARNRCRKCRFVATIFSCNAFERIASSYLVTFTSISECRLPRSPNRGKRCAVAGLNSLTPPSVHPLSLAQQSEQRWIRTNMLRPSGFRCTRMWRAVWMEIGM
jgi:hypothetical protein